MLAVTGRALRGARRMNSGRVSQLEDLSATVLAALQGNMPGLQAFVKLLQQVAPHSLLLTSLAQPSSRGRSPRFRW